jgi:hypothetical protein
MKNIQPVTNHLASRKDVSVDLLSHLCQLPLRTFMRIKVAKMKKKYSLNGSTRVICPFIILPKRPMGCKYINPHNSSILNVFNFNTNIQMAIYHRFSTAHCTQANQHKKRTERNNYK